MLFTIPLLLFVLFSTMGLSWRNYNNQTNLRVYWEDSTNTYPDLALGPKSDYDNGYRYEGTNQWGLIAGGSKMLGINATSVSINGTFEIPDIFSVDWITEYTSAQGVQIDSVLLKDGSVTVTGGATVSDMNLKLSTNSGLYGGSGTAYLGTAGSWSAGLDGSGNFSVGTSTTKRASIAGSTGEMVAPTMSAQLVSTNVISASTLGSALNADSKAITNINIDSGVISIVSANVALDIATVSATALPTEFQGVTGNVFVTIKDQNGKSIALTGFYIN